LCSWLEGRANQLYGHLLSAIGDPGSNRNRAWSGLVASAWAIWCQLWPLARALCTSSGRQRSAWPVRLAIRVMDVKDGPAGAGDNQRLSALVAARGGVAVFFVGHPHRFPRRAANVPEAAVGLSPGRSEWRPRSSPPMTGRAGRSRITAPRSGPPSASASRRQVMRTGWRTGWPRGCARPS
jgi:hypothetical protein